ncbi:angiogenic factor with G patch and FHA domains 1 [Neosynchiropus ocellatus]
METEDGEKDAVHGMTELRLKVQSLQEELKECQAELSKLQKQLSLSERLQKTTESFNEDLRQQVDRLSAEIHEWKKRSKEKVDIETQTDEYVWTEADYYNYYYGGYGQNTETAEAQKVPSQAAATAAVEVAADTALVTETETEAATTAAAVAAVGADVVEENGTTENSTEPQTTDQPASSVAVSAEEGEGGSIADMLRATAEEAMTQTGFIFDETTGMYYDHSTGFYYDSASQLYYDGNTGFYYYYDAESGRYQFHSKVEVPVEEQNTEKNFDKKSWKWKKGGKKPPHLYDKELKSDKAYTEEEDFDWVERPSLKRTDESRKSKRRSRSPDLDRHERDSKRRSERDRSSSRSKKSKHRSRDGERKSKKKRKKSKRKKHKSSRSSDSGGNSEPEEGEITGSEREERVSSASVSRSPSPPPNERPESEMETQSQADFWPPCVRVTVVRSPVLQVGSLFIITADSAATIGREKDMDHAIRIPEMGVSKFHAEVYFDQDQQGYMLVDQGSQNGTVINGNRILQPKTKCDPHALMHGDEVKMGETVLSFHIHTGNDTCDGCEPGQVMAHLSKHKIMREEPAGPALNKEDKEALRQKELKQMKAKYGLQTKEESKSLKNPKYKDRAQSRRQTVGSEGVFQQDDAPASVHVEISEVNKGRKMLEKMGWKKGEGLGKEGSGMRDPIQLKIRKSQSGLGAAPAVSIDDASLNKTKSQKNWDKARERFADACQPDMLLPPPQKSQSPQAWVKVEETSNMDCDGGAS